MASYYWKQCNVRSVPPNAVLGGHDSNGAHIYVGKALHNGDWIPAKVIPSHHVCYVAYGGLEHSKHEFMVLCEQKFKWVRAHGSRIPPHAVEGGRTSCNEVLYIGRAHHANSVTVGKVHPSHGCCYISHGGKEHAYKDYEILVIEQ